jgi:hypothetical protein
MGLDEMGITTFLCLERFPCVLDRQKDHRVWHNMAFYIVVAFESKHFLNKHCHNSCIVMFGGPGNTSQCTLGAKPLGVLGGYTATSRYCKLYLTIPTPCAPLESASTPSKLSPEVVSSSHLKLLAAALPGSSLSLPLFVGLLCTSPLSS